MGKSKKKPRKRKTSNCNKDRNKLQKKKRDKLVPGFECAQMKKTWDNKKTVQENLREMGLPHDSKSMSLIRQPKMEKVKKQCHVQIHCMAEELSALQLQEGADKDSQSGRARRERRKAVEEELDKMYKEGSSEVAVPCQQCLIAERLKDDMHLTLQSTQAKMKNMEMDHAVELSRCRGEMRRLQISLEATCARDEHSATFEERLIDLQQENQQLLNEIERQRKAKLKYHQQVAEYQERNDQLQRRLSEAEQRVATATQELNMLQRRKDASLSDLDTVS
ncbi:sodium channel and clathrin linker 1-like [Engraulis encrasicolus]|uniref:sodium channel and clathrin linker 1-like n=1 Tax=Engraulis encrasicolus TaxID=184585 RepID=UPI002FD12455